MAFWNRKKKNNDFAMNHPQNPFDEIIEKYEKHILKLTDGIKIDFQQDDMICYIMDFDEEKFVQFIVDDYAQITFNIGIDSIRFLTFGISKNESVFKISDGKLYDKNFANTAVDELLLRYFYENESQFSIKNLGNYSGIDGL